jgi:hypothetical protein
MEYLENWIGMSMGSNRLYMEGGRNEKCFAENLWRQDVCYFFYRTILLVRKKSSLNCKFPIESRRTPPSNGFSQLREDLSQPRTIVPRSKPPPPPLLLTGGPKNRRQQTPATNTHYANNCWWCYSRYSEPERLAMLKVTFEIVHPSSTAIIF